MSLLDALLLESYRDPREVWIALRTDGLKGSGRFDDPVHGGAVETSPLNTTLSLAAGTNPREILVTTPGPHGYIEGDIVVFSETRDATGVLAPDFDGPYQIKVAQLRAISSSVFWISPSRLRSQEQRFRRRGFSCSINCSAA